MLFNSYIFIFLFLPVTLLGWYILNNYKLYTPAKLFLAGMSLWFYAYFNLSYLLIIVASILVNFGLSYWLEKKNTVGWKRTVFWIGLLFNLGILFYFKYFDFFLDNINSIFKCSFTMRNILLPLGISFFTFQQLSFIIDRCKGKSKHYGFDNYITFVTFFPQLIAGPIVLYDEMMPQFEDTKNRSFNPMNFFEGMEIFIIGLGKKVLLADVLAQVANYGFDNVIFMDSISTFLCGLAYAFELYFDFSGYSDMAIGLGKMFNINLPVNFNSPYKAASMKELWQRWHITLSRFFVTYVYIPLGGSKKGKARALLNVFIIFMLSGLWHGAAWTYVLWGVIQGLALVWDNLHIIGVAGIDKKQDPKIKIPKLLGQFLTFNYFLGTLYVFRSESLKDAKRCFQNLFSFKITGYLPKLVKKFELPELYVVKEVLSMKAPSYVNTFNLCLFFALLVISIFIITRKNTLELVAKYSCKKSFIVWCGLIFVWSVISFAQVSTFIYFNF